MHAKYVAALTIVAGLSVGAARITSQDVEAGRKKAEICAVCHGLDGNPPQPPLPILAGQTARYLYLQIRDFQQGRRTEPQMTPFVKDLPKGATIATSSTRRKEQLLAARPDLKVVEIRGNVTTRMQKIADRGELDGTILALAGLKRFPKSLRRNSQQPEMTFMSSLRVAANRLPARIID